MDLLCPNEHIVTHTHAINHDMITFLQSLAYFIFRNTVIHRQGSDHKPGAHYKNWLACSTPAGNGQMREILFTERSSQIHL